MHFSTCAWTDARGKSVVITQRRTSSPPSRRESDLLSDNDHRSLPVPCVFQPQDGGYASISSFAVCADIVICTRHHPLPQARASAKSSFPTIKCTTRGLFQSFGQWRQYVNGVFDSRFTICPTQRCLYRVYQGRSQLVLANLST